MKLTRLLLFMALMPGISIAQKAKINDKNLSFSYTVYPEIGGFEHVKTFKMKGYAAEHDLNFSDTWPTNPPLFQLHVGKKNIEGLTYDPANGETLIRLDIREGDLEKEIFEYDLKVGDVMAKRYFYNIKSSTTFNVKWTDVASGAIIMEESFTEQTITNWGGEQLKEATPGKNAGHVNRKNLEDDFELQKKNDSKFYSKIYSEIFKKAFSQYCQSAFVSPFTGRIKPVNRDLSYKLITVKTKETDLFQPLDSALIYMTQVSALMEENQKGNVIGNGLAKNVYPALNRAHQIYKEFNEDKYIKYFTDEELQAEYIFFMQSNLYFTSILLGDFKNAQELLDNIRPEEKPKEQHDGSTKAIINHMKTRGRSEQKKAYDRMMRHEGLVKRELPIWDDIRTRLQL